LWLRRFLFVALSEVVLKGSFHLLRVQLVENAHAAFLVAYRYGFTVWHFAFPPSYEIWIARSAKTQEAESCALVVAFNSISSPKCVKGNQQAFGC
jgi:hypothetical protein